MEQVTVNGVSIPTLGLGTYSMKGEPCRDAVLNAFELGYRHVDTAQMYDNEDAVGEALNRTDVPRHEIFLVTKLRRSNLDHEDVLDSFRRSLDRLDTDYVDLLLIHAPSPSVPIGETVGAMNELQSKELVEHIGVSNFSIPQWQEAIEASKTPVITNQVKYNPLNLQNDLVEFSVGHPLMLTAHTPLARTKVAGRPRLESIAQRHNKSVHQVTLRWLIQQPMVSAIPKSQQDNHLEENIRVFDFELSDAEMKQIFKIKTGWPDRMRSALNLK